MVETVTNARYLADQTPQAFADLGGGVAVVGQHQNAARVLAPDPDEVGDAVDQHPGLAGAGARKDENVGLFAVVAHDLLLCRVAQRLDDGVPGFAGGLPANSDRGPASSGA